MYALNDVNYVCKNHNVILLILLTLLEKLAMQLNLLKKSTTFKNFTWARAQVCQGHPTPMNGTIKVVPYYKTGRKLISYFSAKIKNHFQNTSVCVYKLPCKDFDLSYIGETGKSSKI